MRKFLLIIFFLVACTPPPNINHVPKYVSVHSINFSKYSEKNFLFTPYQYLGDYKSIGLLTISVTPEANLKETRTGSRGGDGLPIVEKQWEIESLDLDKVIEAYYKKAVEMGANAVVDFKITSETKLQYTDPILRVEEIEISGFVIERLGAFK